MESFSAARSCTLRDGGRGQPSHRWVCGAVLGERAVLVRVYRQGADEIAGEQNDRDYGKNAGTVVLFHGVIARNALNVSGTIWPVMRVGIEGAVGQ